MKESIAIIPAYNEALNLRAVYQDIVLNAPSFDVIIINDGSTDLTRELCRQYQIPVLHLPFNLGIGGAVQTGYLYAQQEGYSYAVQFDGDGQHNAAYLERMLLHMKNTKPSMDMVIGSRFIQKKGFQSTLARRIGIHFLSFLIYQLYHTKIMDVTSGLRLVNRKGIAFFSSFYPKDYPEPETLSRMLRQGFRVDEIPVEMKKRQYGKSSIRPFQSIYYMIKVSLAILIDAIKPQRNTI